MYYFITRRNLLTINKTNWLTQSKSRVVGVVKLIIFIDVVMLFFKLIFRRLIGSCVIVWWLTVLVWCIGIGLWSAKRTYSHSGPFTDPFRAKKLMQQGARGWFVNVSHYLKKIPNISDLHKIYQSELIKMIMLARMLWGAKHNIMSPWRGWWACLALLGISEVSGSGYLEQREQPGHGFRYVSESWVSPVSVALG